MNIQGRDIGSPGGRKRIHKYAIVAAEKWIPCRLHKARKDTSGSLQGAGAAQESALDVLGAILGALEGPSSRRMWSGFGRLAP
jgi:hypothetical protein